MLYNNNIAILFLSEFAAIFNPLKGGGIMETLIAALVIISVTCLTSVNILPAESYREIILVLLSYTFGKIMEKKSNANIGKK